MERNAMTFEELVKYTDDAREERDKERLVERNTPKGKSIRNVIKVIVDFLRKNDGPCFVGKTEGVFFYIKDEKGNFHESIIDTTEITLTDLENAINLIPSLIALNCSNCIVVNFREADSEE